MLKNYLYNFNICFPVFLDFFYYLNYGRESSRYIPENMCFSIGKLGNWVSVVSTVKLSVHKMAPLMSVVSFLASLLLTPFLMFLLAIIFLASIGKSLGVRKVYVKLLLALFEVSHFLNNFEHFIHERCLCISSYV